MSSKDFLPQALENIAQVSTMLIHKYHSRKGALPNANQVVTVLAHDFPKSLDAVGVFEAKAIANRQILAFGLSLGTGR